MVFMLSFNKLASNLTQFVLIKNNKYSKLIKKFPPTPP